VIALFYIYHRSASRERHALRSYQDATMHE
jgi:hypothetical protein